MRPDVGLHTLPQRLAGLTAITQSRAAAPPAAAGAFADALAEQVQAQQAPAGTTFATAGGAYAPAAMGLAGRGQLGHGVRLTGAPSVIVPQLPTTGLAASEHAGGVEGHDHHDHAHVALDRTGPPPELQAYGNGRIPPTALEPLGVGDHRLWSPAARAYRDLSAAAARDGVQIGINSSYRDYPTQIQMVERYGLYSQGGRAASPGTSNHGWGVSLDLDLDAGAQAWMRDHARDFGFVEDVPREPWHWTFKASDY